MSSHQLQTESIQARQDQIPAGTVQEEHPPETRNNGDRRRRGGAFRVRGLAIAVAVAAGAASAAAASVASPSHAPETTAQGPSSALSTPAPHVGATSASFARRIRVLEARGYVEVACQVDGDVMFNRRTHRYVTVRA